ncbi:MAG TPA: TIGR01777 family protein [Planctomycetaceae bacterium]|nr:TIGR01777 family protein [Planctomycetaceae bacterium]
MSQILISGASGMVGQALCASLESDGHQVIRLVRNPSQLSETGTVLWSPVDQAIDGDTLKSHGRLDAVVHLAGEGIAAARWSTTQKARIRDSRIVGTRLLANTIAGLPEPPGTLVSASAIGFYGDRGDDWVEESDQPGDMFLSDLCRDWESETDPARQAGIRVVNHRIGVVLSNTGGALQKMLLPFKLGFGGRVGSGKQFWSWITLDDLVASIRHVIDTESIAGPVNAVTPTPATNLQFTRTLGKVLVRPTLFPLPAFIARVMLGEMADELLLASARVRPGVLEQTGFAWSHPELDGALRHALQ